MTLEELKTKIQEYQYFEDTDIIDIALASIVGTRLKLGDPIWLILIGASSGGKSQILRPHALTDTKYMHRIDDLTENTFLSGMKTKDGSNSLLGRIGSNGILVMSDLTVLFSKQKESRAAIMAQFRMIYDGELVKHSGNQSNAVAWRGSLGILAGSTPTIYGHFEEVADMGERFIYYRMKDYDARKAARVALSRRKFGKELDSELANAYDEYIRTVVLGHEGDISIDETIMERVIKIAMFAERIRTGAHIEEFSRDKRIDRIPIPAFPTRVALQLVAVLKGLLVMRKAGGREALDEHDLSIIDWLGWSLANEEKRACLKALGGFVYEEGIKTQQIADKIGLDTGVTSTILQNMSAIGLLTRSGDSNGLNWHIKDKDDYETVRRINGLVDTARSDVNRVLTSEESDVESERVAEEMWNA